MIQSSVVQFGLKTFCVLVQQLESQGTLALDLGRIADGSMRLICPNCGAQYEVDDGVIPEQGRDVQCSNCGHTWFQQPEHLDVETADEIADEAEVSGTPEVQTRQELDPEVAALLREEAAREAEARAADAEGLESQTELGLQESEQAAADRSAAARARMARLRGLDDGTGAAAVAVAAGSRKEMLPDVEEINSSLRPTQERSEQGKPPTGPDPEIKEERARRGGRLGFRLILILVLIAVAVYIYAPFIVQYVPQAEPALVAYVEFVNQLRAQLSGLIQQGIGAVQGLIGGGSDGGAGEG